jgi:hypothetical protein
VLKNGCFVPGLYHGALVHDQHLICQIRHHGQVMADQKGGHLPLLAQAFH